MSQELPTFWHTSYLMQLSLSIDIGGTKCAVGLVTREGELIDRTSVAVNPRDNAEDLFTDIAEAVQQQLARAREHHGESPLTVGVACAGPSTHNLESVSPLNIPQWRDFPLRDRLVDITGLPVFGDGDAKALALAEGWVGGAKGVDNFMAMVVSTGVGGGIVMVPALIIASGMDSLTARGTSLAVIVGSAISGTIANLRKGNIDVPFALLTGLAGVPATFIGVYLSQQVPQRAALILFSFILIAIATQQARKVQLGSAVH